MYLLIYIIAQLVIFAVGITLIFHFTSGSIIVTKEEDDSEKWRLEVKDDLDVLAKRGWIIFRIRKKY